MICAVNNACIQGQYTYVFYLAELMYLIFVTLSAFHIVGCLCHYWPRANFNQFLSMRRPQSSKSLPFSVTSLLFHPKSACSEQIAQGQGALSVKSQRCFETWTSRTTRNPRKNGSGTITAGGFEPGATEKPAFGTPNGSTTTSLATRSPQRGTAGLSGSIFNSQFGFSFRHYAE